ncbi:MAG: hypothetical protein ABR548_00445 [Actinomycetota bacterium]|nr:hypothetical protein [Actinomycetota bacterium]
MFYSWLVFAHLVGVFGFLIAHGVSVSVGLKLRKERDRDRITALLQLSGATVIWLYVSLGVLTAAGLWAAIGPQPKWWSFKKWPKVSLGVLLFASVAMIAMARPYYRRLKEKMQMRASGVPMASEEELADILQSPIPVVLAVIGFGSLGVILWMMVLKPF